MGRIQKNIKQTYWGKVDRFIKRQLQQVQAGGWPIFSRKLLMLLYVIAALPVVLIIRLLRPFIVIRFRQLFSVHIGHYAGNTEIYLCERDAGINVPSQPFIDIWYHMPFVCNSQLKKMWNRTLHIWPAAVVKPVDQLNRFLPLGEAHIISWRADQVRDVYNLLERTPPHLTFLPEEEEQGQSGLREIGVPEGASFVCFHARDSAYTKTVFQNFDASYHDYRDANVNNYVLAAEELTIRGYYVIRMGSAVKESLRVSNPKIIDYATNGHRNDFMDIYLCAKCNFFIGSGSGIDVIAEIFRRPLVLVNNVPLEYVRSWNTGHLHISKKYWLRTEQRFMTFREILESGAGRFLRTQQYVDRGVELIDNTPEEIVAVVIEMDDRLKGTWQTTAEDEEMQRSFRTLFPKSELNGQMVSRIGTEFLRQHREWLE